MNKEALRGLAKHCQRVNYNAGSEVFVQSTDRYFYLIEQGKIEVSFHGKVVDVLNSFEIFGGREIFGLEMKADKARAETDCVIFRIPEPLIDTLLKGIKQELISLATSKLM